MPRTTNVDLLLALLGTEASGAIDGDTVLRRLSMNGRPMPPSTALAQLVALERSGHVDVTRSGGYQFKLTPLGEEAAYELGPGRPVDVVLVMIDLVDYVRFTADNGDGAAHHAARQLHDVGDEELRRAGGKVVKPLGDGILGTAKTVTGAVAAVRAIASRCVRPDGTPWSVRACVHPGRPIAFRGDLFGGDVNLAARLCGSAAPGQLLAVTGPENPVAEMIDVKGLDAPVWVTRSPAL